MANATQEKVFEALKRVFPGEVKKEWAIGRNANDPLGDRKSYLPRVDIAVGPFNLTTKNASADHNLITRKSSHALIQEIRPVDFQQNRNPRCLLAIEIVNSGSSKHVLGDFTNASMMGYMGIIVTLPSTHKKVERISNYIDKLQSVGKAPEQLFKNVTYIEAEQFLALLENAA